MAEQKDAKAREHKGLLVIGAGFGRTGTMSLKLALEQLGLGPTHHMLEVFKNNQASLWLDVLDGHPDWEAIYAKFNSACDFPTCAWYDELQKVYPNAKVILTVRDSPEAWYNSAKETILRRYVNTRPPIFLVIDMLLFNRELVKMWKFIDRLMMRQFGSPAAIRSPEIMHQKYLEHISQVKATVPAEKLLVFNVKQGWKPLCDFLEVPEPQEPFPRINETAQFQTRMKSSSQQAMHRVSAVFGGLSLLGWVLWKLSSRKS